MNKIESFRLLGPAVRGRMPCVLSNKNTVNKNAVNIDFFTAIDDVSNKQENKNEQEGD